MSTGPGNIPERDAPYITPATLDQATAERWRAGCECNRAGLCYRCLAAAEIERLESLLQLAKQNASSWQSVAHDHSERLKVLYAERDRMRAMLQKLAGECAECGGDGSVQKLEAETADPDDDCYVWVDCADCADIRAAIWEAP